MCKARAPGGVSPDALTECVQILGRPLKISKKSMGEGKISGESKRANGGPIFKIADDTKQKTKVSLRNMVYEILEKKKPGIKWMVLQSKNYLSEKQHGFRRMRSRGRLYQVLWISLTE